MFHLLLLQSLLFFHYLLLIPSIQEITLLNVTRLVIATFLIQEYAGLLTFMFIFITMLFLLLLLQLNRTGKIVTTVATAVTAIIVLLAIAAAFLFRFIDSTNGTIILLFICFLQFGLNCIINYSSFRWFLVFQ